MKACIGAMFFLAAVSFLCVVISLGIESLYGTMMFTLMCWLMCFAAGWAVAEYRYQARVRNRMNIGTK